MDAQALTAKDERRQQDMLSGIADWYREEPSLNELERLGRDVLISVVHGDRLIRVESCDRYAPARTPIEQRMEFDRDVLALTKAGLRDPHRAVILDCSDIPGKLGFGRDSRKSMSARVLFLDLASGEVIDEHTVTKEQPAFPEQLRRRLSGVTGVEGNAYVNLRAIAAERFVDEYLHAALDAA